VRPVGIGTWDNCPLVQAQLPPRSGCVSVVVLLDVSDLPGSGYGSLSESEKIRVLCVITAKFFFSN
jgi:hypothetical protein